VVNLGKPAAQVSTKTQWREWREREFTRLLFTHEEAKEQKQQEANPRIDEMTGLPSSY